MSDIQSLIYYNSPRWIQNILLSMYAWQRDKKYRFSKSYVKAKSELKRVEYLPYESIKEYQEKYLHRLLMHCYHNVPYYRTFMRENDIIPTEENPFEILKKMPVIKKSEVQKKWKQFLAENYNERVIELSTSGSTGTPLKIRLSEEASAYNNAVIVRCRGRASYKRGDRITTFAGRRLYRNSNNSPPFWRYNYYGKQLLFSYWNVTEDNLEHYVRKYNRYKPEYVDGYPSFLYIFAEYCLRNKIPLHHTKAIFTSSETLLEKQREVIEIAFNSKIFDEYGSVECVVSATQCEHGSYHVDMELGILEIIDGEAIVTGLHNLAMPLIRYSIGDRLLWDNCLCACGRKSLVIKPPQGRLDDVIRTPSGKLLGRLDKLFYNVKGVHEAQLIQEHINSIKVLIVPNGLVAIDIEYIKNILSERLGDELTYDIKFVESIPRTKSGKYRFVISKLDNIEETNKHSEFIEI